MRPNFSVDSALDCHDVKKQHTRQFELSEQRSQDQNHHADHAQRHCLNPQEIYDHIADAGIYNLQTQQVLTEWQSYPV